MKLSNDDLKIIRACHSNAKKLLKVAQAAVLTKAYNVAYHLAALSMEEVGKASFIASHAILKDTAREKQDSWFQDKLGDHEFKLFWAIWRVAGQNKRILPETFKEAQKIAEFIHKKRLQTLYVSTTGMARISKVDATRLIAFAESRLKLEPPSRKPKENVEPELFNDFMWFIDAIEDEARKALIFSKKSFEMYAQLQGDMGKWIGWLKEQFTLQEQEAQKILDKELARELPDKAEWLAPKWKIRAELIVQGIELKPDAFAWWNKQNTACKLQITKQKEGKFIVDATLPKAVRAKPPQQLIHFGSEELYRLVMALNIGTMGFIWWYHLHDNLTWYKTIHDLENPSFSLQVQSQNPFLNINWRKIGNKTEKGEKVRKLSPVEMGHALTAYAVLPMLEENFRRKFYGSYLHGLMFLAKQDFFMPMVINSGMSFLNAMFLAMQYYDKIKNKADMTDTFWKHFGEILKDPDDRKEFNPVLANFVSGDDKQLSQLLTTDMTIKIKLLCDCYMMKHLKQYVEKRAVKLQERQKNREKRISSKTS